MTPPTRRLLVRLHRWIGLVLGLWIALQGLTGTFIVFRDEANLLFNPSLLRVEPRAPTVTPGTALERIGALHPQARIERIDVPIERGRAYRIWLYHPGATQPSIATIDPGDGRVLGFVQLWQMPAELLFRLHYSLLGGDAGRLFVGVLGALFLALTITGPLLWWQGKRRLRQSLTIQLKFGRARALFDLHRVIGAIACLVLIPTAVTGMATALKPQLIALLHLPGVKLSPASTATIFTAPTIDALAERTLAETPGTELRNIRFSGPRGETVLMIFGPPGEEATGRIWFDRRDGRVLGFYGAHAAPAAIELPDTILWLHKAMPFGLAGRGLLLLAGLVPALLFVTGSWMWFRRARGRRVQQACKSGVA